MADVLKKLKSQKTGCKCKLTRASKYLDELPENHDSIDLATRHENIAGVFAEFERIQTDIEILEDLEFQEEERSQFEEKYLQIISSYKRFIKALNTPNKQDAKTQDTNQQIPNYTSTAVRLPIINLPVFSGAYEDWLTFYDTFTSLIHSDKSIPDIQKFHYLKSSLSGNASSILSSLSVSTENYIIAWDMLNSRYNNKRIIIHHHIKRIHELPVLHKENFIVLRQIVDGLLKHTRALTALGRPVEHWDDLLIYSVTKKLDTVTNKEWENTLSTPSEIPTLNAFTDFLSKKCQTLETISKGVHNIEISHSKTVKTTSHVVASHKPCPMCSNTHFIFHCDNFLKLSVEQRINICKSKRLCLNCLWPGHRVSECKGGLCRICKGKHNTLLHSTQVTQPQTPTQGASVTINNHASEIQAETHAMLSTANILIKDVKGKHHECRALLDCGSQSNFITKSLANRLGIKQEQCTIPVVGINQTSTDISRAINVKIKSRLNAFESNMRCLVIDKISGNLPLVSIQRSFVDIPKNIKLADPEFNISKPIDLLIGVDIFWKLMCVGQIKASESKPCFQKTHFGWIIAGSITYNNSSFAVTHCNLTANKSLDEQISQFWQLEEFTEKRNFTTEGLACERHFIENVKRNNEGRFVVKLPFKNKTDQLGNSYQLALKRFYNLERRLDKHPQLKIQYSDFLQEYIDLGHMKPIDVNPFTENSSSSFYLPHHAVEKCDSTTTKLRVVFDGSSKSSSGHSLNDILMVGPTIQEDLFSIVSRFRTHQIALTADIAKMYRQVLVDDSDAHYQRILWSKNCHSKIQIYNLATVTYGTSSASFLAIRAMQQLAQGEAENFPLGARIALRDFYVDDLITGANTHEEAMKLVSESKNLLHRGGFELRKWQSNRAELFDNSDTRSSSEHVQVLDKSNSTKALGLSWNKNEDTLFYQLPSQYTSSKVNKRSILSFISQLFDPLGLLGPIIIVGKILMQRLWQLKINWDESIPSSIYTQFTEYKLQFRALERLKIPRNVIHNTNDCILELHGFSDASQEAYGACVYIRTISSEGRITCNLLCAKSKVAPIKSTTIPRLELCGALLLSQLIERITSTINLEFRQIYYWTDSTIVLAWVKSTTKLFKTFVANRISEIQELTDCTQWNHVISENNPADIISRGSSLANLISCNLWWHGPAFLLENSEVNISTNPGINFGDIMPEEKPIHTTSHIICDQTTPINLFSKFSSLTKLLRITSYCLRFVKNVANRLAGKADENNIATLTNQELEIARKQLVCIVQGEQFPNELRELSSTGTVSSKSKLLSLNPFLDNDGLIRVGGRLRHATLPYKQKHPLILPAKHEFTALVIQHHHRQQLNAGIQGTIASIRSQYWPLSLRNSVKHIIKKCITCFKVKPRNESYIMSDLPCIRLGQCRPFLNSGVDFCGPFQVREHKRRNSKTYKIYVAIFVCLSTKAVHIETVSDLTTEAFLNTLKRFMARRGRIANLYSDNATNFTGTNNEIKKLLEQFKAQGGQDKLSRIFLEQQLKWHFIPPRSPNFGGIWEAAVKSMKHHLRRIVGNTSVTLEQMQTFLLQIESVLNSRPLTPISNDPNDESFLTPAHFLIGDTFVALPEPELVSLKQNRLSLWQHIELLKQHFWKRWTKEYLSLLQQRTKWKTKQEPGLSPGQLVIIKEDNLPPLRWVTGRIEEVHPGPDGVVRAATVRVKGDLMKRPTTKLCVLPLEHD